MATTLPFGSWPSPITPRLVTGAGARFSDLLETDHGDLYWVESRPADGGRSVVVRRSTAGVIGDVVPVGANARSRVHEYGGGAYTVRDRTVWYVEFTDQRIHRIVGDGEPMPITPLPETPGALRYADLEVGDGRIFCVREDHTSGGEPDNTLVCLPDDGSAAPEVIASGHDFYAAPRVSPDGGALAFLTWDHPDMPWNGTTLWMVALENGRPVGEPQRVGGGRGESICQPAWSPTGILHCSTDRSGWWNVYRAGSAGLEPVLVIEADVGAPQWVFGTRRFGFRADGSLVAASMGPAGASLTVVAPDGATRSLPAPGTSIGAVTVEGTTAFLVAGAPDLGQGVVAVDTDDGASEVVFRPAGPSIDPGYVSAPAPITFDTPDGPAHAYYYGPANPDCAAPPGDLPPLLVVGHGGPTSATSTTLDLSLQFWTSRGFAVVDVDYGGSTGYGRPYRERLAGRWGIVDVRDCALAARHLVAERLADPERISFRGWSAGGYTTLAALAFEDVATAGASHFGVADPSLLAEHTHKFESRYLDWLIGPYPQDRAVYEERSPLRHAGRITAPVILFQGLEDRVVPPEQAREMAAALRGNGVPVALVEFEGEGHGFRSESAQIAALEAELSFYGRVWGFQPAGDPPAPVIEGL